MDKLDKDLLVRVEQALHIKLKEWQVNYILDIPMVLDLSIADRGTGKTTAYIIKLLFSDDEPIRLYSKGDILKIADNTNDLYLGWFEDQLYSIYVELESNEIRPRPVFRTELGYRDYILRKDIGNFEEFKYFNPTNL